MNTKKFIEIGNIFDFAEARLIEKDKRGDIYGYTLADIIDQAVRVRKYMDNHPKGLKIPTMTKEERKARNRILRKLHYVSQKD